MKPQIRRPGNVPPPAAERKLMLSLVALSIHSKPSPVGDIEARSTVGSFAFALPGLGPKPTNCRVVLPLLLLLMRLEETTGWDLRHSRRPVVVVLGPKHDQ